MNVREVVEKIGERLPIELVSNQDNVGLVLGNYDDECDKMLIAYELNEEVVDEAVRSGFGLVTTYHTPLFRPTKSFTSSQSFPDPLLGAARSRLNVLAVHTALDIVKDGLNLDLALRLGLKNVKFLSPIKDTLYKIVVFVPKSHSDLVRAAMAQAGAGRIGDYSECAFSVEGTGNFIPGADASPYVGEAGKLEDVEEVRIEMLTDRSVLGRVVRGMLKVHPYEEVAYDVYPLANESANYGFGAIGELDSPVSLTEYLDSVKSVIGLKSMNVSHLPETKVKKVALCAGAGMPFYNDAVRKGADVFITGDVRHHDFRVARSHATVLADATHHGTERFAPELLLQILKETFQDIISIDVSKYSCASAVTV